MPINLDQTGPAHLLSTDEDGLILNGSPVISKSIHVSNIEPKTYFGDTNTKLLWLDTGVQGVSSFPNGGAANWILRTNGNGTVSWIPPSTLDATKFHYRTSTNNTAPDPLGLGPGSGYVRFVRDEEIDPMSTATKLVISNYSVAGDPNYIMGATPGVPSYNDIGSFINGLSAYGNNSRRGFIKVEKENDPNHFQIYSFSTIVDRVGWFEIDVEIVRVETGDENFPNDEPVSVNFSVAGPEALTQDLSNYVTFTGTQTLTNKTITTPIITEPSINNKSTMLTDVAIGSNGTFTCNASTLRVHDALRVTGLNAGDGSITGYDDVSAVYFITATNGTTSFTLSDTLGGVAITTVAGTVSGAMTFTNNVGGIISFDDADPTNGFETRLTVISSSADHKIILPDATTTLVGIDNIQTLTNKTIIEPIIHDPEVIITDDDVNITISSNIATSFNSRINTADAKTYSWATNYYFDGTNWLKDNDNRGGWRLSKVADITLDANNKIILGYASIGSNVEDQKFILNGDGQLELTSNIASTTTSTGTLVVDGGVGIGGDVNIGGDTTIIGILAADSIESTPIGTAFRSTGAFTTLDANGIFQVTDATISTSQTTGAAVITGGLGVGGAAYVNGPVYLNDLDPLETKLTDYSLIVQNPQAKVRVGPNYTAGAVDYIDILTLEDNPTITTTSLNFTLENLESGGNITLTATDASIIITENTASTDKVTGALKVAGGIGVALDIHADDIYVYGQTGLNDTASQVVSLAATQTLTNKTINAPTIDDIVLTGTVSASSSTGIAGQLLSSTGTGVEWVNPVTNSAVVFYKASDQNFFTAATVTLPASPTIVVGSDFGDMNGAGSGIFTFSVAGTYQIIINYSVSDTGGGATYPTVDFWVRKNSADTIKYCQVLTNGSRRGAVTEYIEFDVNDTVQWYVNSTLRVNGGSPSATGSRFTIVRVE